MLFDVIGDIHGHAQALRELLGKLGYRHDGLSYAHPERKVLFLGDFIDRGPEQLGTLIIVKGMMDHGRAFAVMGNHELNAIGWATKGKDGQFLRAHTERNFAQHKRFLEEVGDGSSLHAEWVAWMMTLPVWLELSHIQAVHACWEPSSLNVLRPYLSAQQQLQHEYLPLYFNNTHEAFVSIERLMKGPEVVLPEGVSFRDSNDIERKRARLKWWSSSRRYTELLSESASVSEQVERKLAGQMPCTEALMSSFPIPTKPTFVGHYWLRGEPAPLNDRVACLDYSVAGKGKLVAYRFSGESTLKPERFVSHQ